MKHVFDASWSTVRSPLIFGTAEAGPADKDEGVGTVEPLISKLCTGEVCLRFMRTKLPEDVVAWVSPGRWGRADPFKPAEAVDAEPVADDVSTRCSPSVSE
jgi:hypothetical protein